MKKLSKLAMLDLYKKLSFSQKIVFFMAEHLAYISVVVIFVSILLSYGFSEFAMAAITLALVAGISYLVSVGFKKLFSQKRPYIHNFFVANGQFSFPSTHATILSAVAFTLLNIYFGFGVIMLLVTVATGVGRVLAGVHRTRDIVGGIFLGYLVAAVVLGLF